MTPGKHRGPRRRQIWPASQLAIAVVFIAGVACCTVAIVGMAVLGTGII